MEFALIYGFPLVCLALILLRTVVWVFELVESSSWPSTYGVIQESSIQLDHDGDSDVVLRFMFVIDDQPYWGNQTMSVKRDYDRARLEADYPIGKTVSVIYNPADPENGARLGPS